MCYNRSMLKETDIAWAAGFIDGEGCISTPVRVRVRNRRDYSLALYVGQVDPRPLLRLRDWFGGTVVPRTSWGRGRPIFMWRITGNTAEAALRTLLPYLTVKQEQARLALALRKMIRSYVIVGRRVDDAETNARMELVAAIKAEKWRHHDLPTLDTKATGE